MTQTRETRAVIVALFLSASACTTGLPAEAPAREAAMQRITADDPSVLLWGRWAAPSRQAAAPKGAELPPGIRELVGRASAAAALFGPSARQCGDVAATCVLRFNGPAVRWLGGKGPDHGRADVLLDGKPAGTVDTYAPAAAAGQVLLERDGLPADRTHELRIVIRRDRNPRSAGRMLRIEAFEAAEPVNYPARLRQQAAGEMELIVSGKRAYLKPEQWKPVAYAAKAPPRGVALDGGPLRVCFDRNIEYLRSWFAGKADWQAKFPKRGWERHLPASSEGRMLGGAANSLRWGERKDMRAIVDTLVGIVKARQRDDGYCMPFAEENMNPSRNAWFDERRNYDRVNLTRGMVAAATAGNADALPVMRRFYDWLYASPYCAGLLAGPFSSSAHNCANACEGSMLMYFSPAGKPQDLVCEERYLVQDCIVEAARKADPLSLCYYPCHVPHCYVLLAYKAWLDHYRGTGAGRYIEAAKGAWQIVHDHYLCVGGTLGICEEGPGSYPPDSCYLRHQASSAAKWKGPHHTGETCGSVFWTDINHRLLQFFPDEAKYADEIEAELLNAILAAQDARGNIRYHGVLMGGKAPAGSQNTCCEVMGVPLIASLPQFIYSIAPDGLYVNLHAPSTIAWKQSGRDVTLAATTGFPFSGKVTLKFDAAAATRMKLRIRVPGWAGRDVDFAVNGASAAKGKPGSYAVLEREWRPGDTVAFELPMPFRTVRYSGLDQDAQHDRYALLYGPVLLALLGAEDLDIPAPDLPGRLKGVAGKPLHFAVDGVAGVEYVPYWQIDKEAFVCFPTMR